jgi:hypothetical protein
MADDLRAKRHQKPWQSIEQNHTEGRGRFERRGSNQPKPWAGRRQTAQSTPRGCQSRRRSLTGMGWIPTHHAALPICSADSAAPKTSERMAARLKEKVMSAEAW